MNKAKFKTLIKPGNTYWLSVEGKELILNCKEDTEVLILISTTNAAAKQAYHRYQQLLIGLQRHAKFTDSI